MIHRNKEDERYDQISVFILGDVSNDKVKNLESLLEKDGYGATVIANDRTVPIAGIESGAVLLLAEDRGHYPLQKQIDKARPIATGEALQFSPSHALTRDTLRGNYRGIIGSSPEIIEVLKQVDKVADTKAKVLIYGETGTGKELVARALHQNSERAANEMVSLNCAAIPGTLLESELFGHEKGAFTDATTQRIGKLERAHNGTMFLDEIGDMSLSLQAKLLRAIETGEIERLGGTKPIRVDVRIVAATHCDLAEAIENGTFRRDLYYRLNAVSLSLPPLRERQEDIRMLAEYFLERHCDTYRQPMRKILPETFARLQKYPWPGNIRELENALIHAVILADGETILPGHLPKEILMSQKLRRNSPKEIHNSANPQAVTVPLGTNLKGMEEVFIRATLASQNGNRTKTASLLGISIRTLQNRLKDYEESERVSSAS